MGTGDDRHRDGRDCAFAWWWYAGNAAAVILLVMAPVWLKAALHRFHNYDLGIFAQALHAIRPDDLNPFLPALNRPVFSDHFDPILLLFAPLARFLEPVYAALTVEHALVILSPLPIVLLCRRDARHLPYACFAVTYLLFNRGTVSALNFPVHPTTWAACFLVAVAAATAARRHGLLVLAAIGLMACKEEFPFVVAAAGVCLVWRGDVRVGVALAVLALVWCAVAFGLRPLLVGDTHDYASRVLAPVLTDPAGTLRARLLDLKGMKRLLYCALPLVPLVAWQLKNRVAPDGVLLSGLVPMLAIRFLDGAWAFHYMAPVVALAAAALWRRDRPALPPRYAAAAVAITVVAVIHPLAKSVSAYGTAGELGGMRMASIEAARSHLLGQPHGKVVAGGNLTPLLARRPDVFQIGGVQPPRGYRFLFTEKPPGGDPWPLKHPDVQRLVDAWRNRPSTVILRDDAFVFLARDDAPVPGIR